MENPELADKILKYLLTQNSYLSPAQIGIAINEDPKVVKEGIFAIIPRKRLDKSSESGRR